MTKKYIPKKGDIVWLDFDPSAGMEIQKRRPALVVSQTQFNFRTSFAVVCPITSTMKKNPTRYTLSPDMKTKGQIVIHQLKAVDFSIRQIEFIEKINEADMNMIDQVIGYIF